MKFTSAVSILLLFVACNQFKNSDNSETKVSANSTPGNQKPTNPNTDEFAKGVGTFSLPEGSAKGLTTNSICNGSVSFACADASSTQADASTTTNVSNNATEKQIIVKSANLSVSTDSFRASEIQLKQIISQYELLVQDQKQESSNNILNGTYTFRVAAEKLEIVVNLLSKLGKECTQNQVKSEDVTSEFVDLELRLKTKHTVYEQYLALLRQAKTVDDILKVQESARVLREEIESMEGRVKFLSNRAQYSTIYLNLYQMPTTTVNPTPSIGLGNKIKSQFKRGIRIIEYFFLFLVAIWPLLLALVPIVIFRKQLKKIFGKTEELEEKE